MTCPICETEAVPRSSGVNRGGRTRCPACRCGLVRDKQSADYYAVLFWWAAGLVASFGVTFWVGQPWPSFVWVVTAFALPFCAPYAPDPRDARTRKAMEQLDGPDAP